MKSTREAGHTRAADWLRLLRPRQWTKNLVVLAGLLFTGGFLESHELVLSLLAVAVFCVISSAGYVINDLHDLRRDRAHPTKRKRPIAAGRIGVSQAFIAAVALYAVGLACAWIVDHRLFTIAGAYAAFTLLYTLYLKHQVILDVLSIAVGFVLRAVAGAVVIGVGVSPWLFVCVSLLALLVGFGKRRSEVALLTGSAEQRPVLSMYSKAYLDQAITMSSTSAAVTYAVYAISSPTAHSHPSMVVTLPIVFYSLLRYIYLIFHHNMGESPEDLFLKDRPLLLSVVVWFAAVLAIFKWS